MPISSKLTAAAFASIAAMGSFALMTGTPAFADHHAKAAEASQPNIVETAMGTGVHGTRVAAVKAADLLLAEHQGELQGLSCRLRPS